MDHDLTKFISKDALLRCQCAHRGEDEESDAMNDLLQVKLLFDLRLRLLEESAILRLPTPVKHVRKITFLWYLYGFVQVLGQIFNQGLRGDFWYRVYSWISKSVAI